MFGQILFGMLHSRKWRTAMTGMMKTACLAAEVRSPLTALPRHTAPKCVCGRACWVGVSLAAHQRATWHSVQTSFLSATSPLPPCSIQRRRGGSAAGAGD
jgi:hypothetical protein